MSKSDKIIKLLVEELRTKLPVLHKGQVFETMKTIFPREKGKGFIVPLAMDKKVKKETVKRNSSFIEYINDPNRGDLLEVVNVEGDKAYCINISSERTSKDNCIIISYQELVEGIVKEVKKNVKRIMEEK